MDDLTHQFHFSPAKASMVTPGAAPKISARAVNVYYGDKQALFDVSFDIADRAVTALMGPSGCGKTTFMRCVNRLNDRIEGCRVTGSLTLDGREINTPDIDAPSLRARVGMVFQKPMPFPQSVYDNVAYGPRIQRKARTRAHLDEIVEQSLVRAGLWNEVKDQLKRSGLDLSGGQQQRLIIARALAIEPEVLLMDEPCSALDPGATALIENLIDELRAHYCIVIVTHSLAQAARVSQYAVYFHLGKVVETGNTEQVFTHPRDERLRNYLEGRVG